MLKWTRRILLALLALTAALALAAWLAFRGSLPPLDGEQALPGLSAPATLARDAEGRLILDAANATDMARALGFAHGQERFFEMDLSRRLAAGELAALVGEKALPIDRRNRLHRLRARSEASLATLAGDHLPLLEAYAEGVNAGLASLHVRPWPYLLLRQPPEPWTPTDTTLVGYAMFFDLQDETNSRELALWRLREALPAPLAALVLRDGTAWDAPLLGAPRGDALLPDAGAVDLRTLPRPEIVPPAAMAEPAAPGSNNFAVAASASRDGRAILAGDMHLALRAPSLWFPARLRYADPSAPQGRVDITGVTLPGVPGVIAGSTEHVAWAFTNSYGDWLDFFRIDFVEGDPSRYRTPEGDEALVIHEEILGVAHGDAETLTVRETRWGPIAHDEADGSALALRWTAQQPGSLDLGLLDLTRAKGLDEALVIARRAGVPAQNMLIADTTGRIAWRLAGRIPVRTGGCDPTAPLRPLDGCDWAGWLAPEAPLQPELVDPPAGRLFSANARMVDGPLLALVGDSGYAFGARQKQIADALAAGQAFSEADLLALQLDDRALFLERWNRLLRAHLGRRDDAASASLIEAAADWSGRAGIDSSGYRLTRAFRLQVLGHLRDGLLGPARARLGERFVMPDLPQFEGVAWPLLEQRPMHLLPPHFETWDALIDDALGRAVAEIRQGRDGPLRERTWGEANTSHICHPLSSALPPDLEARLCMPPMPLPGDAQMPRVQAPGFGASQRMVVSPSRREDGLFQLPGGPAGHPLSPYWGAGHAAWTSGEPRPFLPGPARHALRLAP